MSATGTERPAAAGSLTGKKILIVDDDDALRDSLSEQLQLHEEFATALSETARDALEIVKKDYFDAILLDVDNGPDSFTQPANSRLYTRAGLAAARAALRPGGALAVWSVGQEPTFERRLRAAGFEPSTHSLNARGKRGRRHVVFVGRKL